MCGARYIKRPRQGRKKKPDSEGGGARPQVLVQGKKASWGNLLIVRAGLARTSSLRGNVRTPRSWLAGGLGTVPVKHKAELKIL